ncbi:MAG: outer membrane protein transport protein [Hyphomicrobiales bacterium]
MNNKIILGSTLAFAMIASSTAISGGFSRGGVDYNVLFSDKKVDSEVGFTFVAPQRTIDSSARLVNLAAGAPGASPTVVSSTNTRVDGSFFVPKAAIKLGFGDHFDCAGTFSTPFGADQDNGLNQAVSGNAVEFEIDTKDYGLTCSAKFSLGNTRLGESQLRVIAGGSYLQFDGFLSRQSFVDFAGVPTGVLPFLPGTGGALTGLDAQGLGLFELDDDTFTWRAGLSYEIPKSAIRVSAVYTAAYDIDATGTVDISQFNTPAALLTPTAPIALSTELPQQVDINIQSGINEKTLAFARFNWTDWSQLGSIPVTGVPSPTVPGLGAVTAFEPLYRDGLTLTGGVGRKFSEKLSGLLSLTWDRGTATTTGTQSATWLVTSGLSFKANDKVDLQLGGAVGILTSGSTSGEGTILNTASSARFGNDFIGAFSASAKISF